MQQPYLSSATVSKPIVFPGVSWAIKMGGALLLEKRGSVGIPAPRPGSNAPPLPWAAGLLSPSLSLPCARNKSQGQLASPPSASGGAKKRPAQTLSVDAARKRSQLLDPAGVKFHTQKDEGHPPGLRERLPEVLTDAASPLAQIMSTVKEAAHRLSKSKMSLYAVLDLKKGASPEDIKKSYRHLSSCVLCSLVAVSVVAVEHLNHHLSRIVGENISRMSRVSLQGQVRTASRDCEVLTQ
nr:dnaJ homolog subfamily C member 5G isoform X7 [Gorilla gorilla gorilla]